MLKQCTKSFFERDTLTVAKDLIGCELHIGSQKTIITETEAYLGLKDEASHAFKGVTPRTAIMFSHPGFVYIYLIYGMYYCLNFVCEPDGIAGAVLIRGVTGINGPGKLTRHYGITKEKYHGLSLVNKDSVIKVYKDDKADFSHKINTTPRIGISKAKESLFRFVLNETL